MTDVTRILSRFEHGDPTAAEQLLPIVYDELRRLAAARLAHEKPGQTLQATALVHEAYLRLVGSDATVAFENRRHFFAAAAEAMRRLLIDRARRVNSKKHGGEWQRVELSEPHVIDDRHPEEVIAVDDALACLAKEDNDAAEVVKLVLYGGFSVEEAGKLLGMSRSAAYRNWLYARAWLKSHVDQ